jgi:hypothetical protein
MPSALNTNTFIEKAIKKHGDKFDYSLVEYEGTKSKVKIKCPEHGIFEQIAGNHLWGRGCNKCSMIIVYKGNTIKTDDFIKRAKQIHGDKYDYSVFEYIKNDIKSKFICKIHGTFEQTPASHVNSKGCIKCGLIEMSKKIKVSKEEFIVRANEIHNNKFNYSLVHFNGVMAKVEIICPTHGIFTQAVYGHLSGHGCIKCNQSKGEQLVSKLLNENFIIYETQHKFIDCINPKTNYKLPFDFYLPDYNLCIEYDGRQHYISNDFFKHEGLDKRQLRDELKNLYCKEKNIQLIRISYKENIFEKLKFLFVDVNFF